MVIIASFRSFTFVGLCADGEGESRASAAGIERDSLRREASRRTKGHPHYYVERGDPCGEHATRKAIKGGTGLLKASLS